MGLKLNLGDIVQDTDWDHILLVVAKADANGNPVVLEGYENHPEVARVFPFISDADGRVVIILENGENAFLHQVGEGYYTWIDDPNLTEEFK